MQALTANPCSPKREPMGGVKEVLPSTASRMDLSPGNRSAWERDVPADALYGIHTLRALENFPLSGRPVHPRLIHAYGAVKLACGRTNHELGSLGRRHASPPSRPPARR